MDKRNNDFDFDFRPLGLAIKKARKAQGVTREQLANIIDYNPRHLQAVENEGQYPSIELFLQLITMFDVSVDEHIHTGEKTKKKLCPQTFGCYARPTGRQRTVDCRSNCKRAM